MRKNISLDLKVIEKAEEKAISLGMTFSGYLLYLLTKDLEVK